MTDALALLWPHMEVPRPLLSSGGPRLARDALCKLQAVGFVKRAENTRRVVCPGCYEGHIEDVVAVSDPDGSCRFFVYCPEVLRAKVSVEHLRQWTIDFRRLAEALAASMSLRGKYIPTLARALWRLGRTEWRGDCGMCCWPGG